MSELELMELLINSRIFQDNLLNFLTNIEKSSIINLVKR